MQTTTVRSGLGSTSNHRWRGPQHCSCRRASLVLPRPARTYSLLYWRNHSIQRAFYGGCCRRYSTVCAQASSHPYEPPARQPVPLPDFTTGVPEGSQRNITGPSTAHSSGFLRQLGTTALLVLVGSMGFARAARAQQRPPQPMPTATTVFAERPQNSASAGEASTSGVHSRWGVHDTGIELAAKDDSGYTPDKQDIRRALEKYMDEGDKRKLAPHRKGKKVDRLESVVPDPTTIPDPEAPEMQAVATAWRPDKLKNMTYTQFWDLIRERKIDRVEYTGDKRAVWVTTKASAPGGVRTQKVGLPYDPDLFDHMVEHGVIIDAVDPNPMEALIAAVVRLAFPIWFAIYLVQFAFRIGRKRKRDRLFGGARLEMVSKKGMGTTFDDIAGIDTVKAEIMELVSFLRNPRRFLDLGCRSPAGVLLVGPPGTGKTLLAKAIAGEAGVPFFSAAGTEFMEMFVGVGASRVRDMFNKARKAAPCILFIDEFDGIGKQRSFSGMGNDESVHTINQLLTEMDGFLDNTGVVVMAATNRPAALDSALTRPGRFDRIVHLPLPNLEGRVGILKVHARGKEVDEALDYDRVARATAGFTGAELMNLMNQSAIITIRGGREIVTEDDVFQALEKIHQEKFGRGSSGSQHEEGLIPPLMRRTIAVYEAGRALIGYITPYYDEISKVSVCPGGVPTGYTYFIPSEEHLESRVVTRGFMEGKMTVAMAGRCAEKLVMGEANVTTAGAADLEAANNVAREMVYRCGFSRKLGPVTLMDTEEVYINREATRRVANISTELARIALSEVQELIDGAEAKAYYGLARNYRAMEALVELLLDQETINGQQLQDCLERNGVQKFPDPFVEGFGWDASGRLHYPGSPEVDEADDTEEKRLATALASVKENGASSNGSAASEWHPLNPYQVRVDLPDLLSSEDLF